MVPIFGGRYWTQISTVILVVPCLWFGIAVQNPATPFWIFILIALLCGFCWLTLPPAWATSAFFYPKAKGSALGVNGGPGNLAKDAAVLAAVVIFVPISLLLVFCGVDFKRDGAPWPGNSLNLVPPLLAATGGVVRDVTDIAAPKPPSRDQSR